MTPKIKMISFSKYSSDDLKLGQTLHTDRYKLIRYEDLVADPVPIILQLYSFIGVKLTKQMIRRIKEHFSAEKIERNVK